MNNKRKIKGFCLLLIISLICFSISLPVFADETPSEDANITDDSSSDDSSSDSSQEESSTSSTSSTTITNLPSPNEDFYVLDNANVLSASTESEILTSSKSLYEKYGIQLVFVTITSANGATTHDYCYSLFNNWNIGGDAGNGILVLLDIGDDTYTAMAGAGLMSTFTSDVLKSALDTKLEEDFAAKNYDSGITKLNAELTSQLETFATTNNLLPPENGGTGTNTTTSTTKNSGSVFGTIVTVIVVIVAILVAGLALIYIRGQMVRQKRRAERSARRSQPTQNNHSRTSYYSTNNKYDFDSFRSDRTKNSNSREDR